MSNLHLNLAFEAPILGAKKSVLIALSDRMNQDGYCYPALDDIAFRAGCTKRTAISAVKELEIAGYISVIRVHGRVNKYIFCSEKLSTTSETISPSSEILAKRSETISPSSEITTPGINIKLGETISPSSEILAKRSETISPSSEITTPKPLLTQLTLINPKNKHRVISKPAGEITPASVCVFWRDLGLIFSNPLHPDLIALVEADTPWYEFEFAAKAAVDRGKGFNYALGIVKGRAADAQRELTHSKLGGHHAASHTTRTTSRIEHSRQIGAHLDQLFEQEFGSQMGSGFV
jgi:Helix-turn-helix domain